MAPTKAKLTCGKSCYSRSSPLRHLLTGETSTAMEGNPTTATSTPTESLTGHRNAGPKRPRNPPAAAREFTPDSEILRERILDLVEEFAQSAHQVKPFSAGHSHIPASGKVYGAEDIRALVDASLDFWLTTGR